MSDPNNAVLSMAFGYPRRSEPEEVTIPANEKCPECGEEMETKLATMKIECPACPPKRKPGRPRKIQKNVVDSDH